MISSFSMASGVNVKVFLDPTLDDRHELALSLQVAMKMLKLFQV